MPLGPTDRLDVAWKGTAPRLVQALQTATGSIDIRIDDTQVATEAELSLQMKSGQTALWQIQAPPQPQASVEVVDLLPSDPAHSRGDAAAGRRQGAGLDDQAA